MDYGRLPSTVTEALNTLPLTAPALPTTGLLRPADGRGGAQELHELLDEVMDYGVPQSTVTKIPTQPFPAMPLPRPPQDYCGLLTEEAVRKNFTLIYELLDEVMDYGVPQSTVTKILTQPFPAMPRPAHPRTTAAC